MRKLLMASLVSASVIYSGVAYSQDLFGAIFGKGPIANTNVQGAYVSGGSIKVNAEAKNNGKSTAGLNAITQHGNAGGKVVTNVQGTMVTGGEVRIKSEAQTDGISTAGLNAVQQTK